MLITLYPKLSPSNEPCVLTVDTDEELPSVNIILILIISKMLGIAKVTMHYKVCILEVDHIPSMCLPCVHV